MKLLTQTKNQKKCGQTFRPIIKAKPVLLKLRKDLDAYTRRESHRLGKTLVRFVEECIEARKSGKPHSTSS